jgi:uncharacterized protein (DUF1499 family)
MSRFPPTPKSPNCVSSRAEPSDRQHYIRPFEGTTLARVHEVVSQMPRTEVKTHENDYLHVVFTTALFRFRDDVEFEVEGDTVHVRSASRVGYGDLGANRKRVEAIRRALGG